MLLDKVAMYHHHYGRLSPQSFIGIRVWLLWMVAIKKYSIKKWLHDLGNESASPFTLLNTRFDPNDAKELSN